ncbi:hypothetical protein QMG61_05260 [Cryobacterium sp. PH31-AA6]|uniref:hypothetical protein n=1 Tax=Cryobacterium sp. PH31-AA6 TaxID=3046205 RepID=UPI0024B964E1|nr:hypothetical protein [Cryobacterium sp. PH31-AA6]MDJ0323171.1 hypothetical protein [Cryobacterium sp. PH31-AA6]
MGVRVSVSLTSMIGEVSNMILAGVVTGQNIAAERLLALSAAEAPMDDVGALVASGQVDPATNAGDDATVVYDAPYSARWHEDQALVDSLGRRYAGGSNFQNGRKSKYLEDPALQNKDELGQIIATEAGRG